MMILATPRRIKINQKVLFAIQESVSSDEIFVFPGLSQGSVF